MLSCEPVNVRRVQGQAHTLFERVPHAAAQDKSSHEALTQETVAADYTAECLVCMGTLAVLRYCLSLLNA